MQVTPSSATVPPGENVTLQCTAEGSPTVSSIEWSRVDGSPLPSHSVSVDGTLYLFSVSSAAAGAYDCTATNTLGTTITQTQITVLGQQREK